MTICFTSYADRETIHRNLPQYSESQSVEDFLRWEYNIDRNNTKLDLDIHRLIRDFFCSPDFCNHLLTNGKGIKIISPLSKIGGVKTTCDLCDFISNEIKGFLRKIDIHINNDNMYQSCGCDVISPKYDEKEAPDEYLVFLFGNGYETKAFMFPYIDMLIKHEVINREEALELCPNFAGNPKFLFKEQEQEKQANGFFGRMFAHR